jgi:hypothetical protein
LVAEQDKLKNSRHPIFAKPPWKEATAVGRALAGLRHDTDLTKVKAAGTLSDDERTRMTRLKEDLSKDPAKAAAEQKLKADNIKHLLNIARQLEDRTSDSALSAFRRKGMDAVIKREAARLAAEKAFSSEALEGVGGNLWRALWDSARKYSTEAVNPGVPFPPTSEGELCVLCQQPLGLSVVERMARFEEFIQEDTEKGAQEAEASLKSARLEFLALSISFRSSQAQLRKAALQNATLARRTRRFVAAARLRRYLALQPVKEGNYQLPDAPESPIDQLTSLEKTLQEYSTELQKAAGAEERRKLQAVACVAIWPKVLHIIWRMRWGDTQPCPITKLSRAASTTPVETL